MSKTFKYTEVRFYFYKASDLGQTTTLSKHAFFFFFKVFGDQPWVFFGRNDAKAETPVLWPPHAKSWLLEKTLMLGGIGGRRKRDERGWDGWLASPPRWTWVWVNSGPSSRWCHPAISSSVVPFSSCPQSLPASESFPRVNSLHEVAKVLEFQL